MALPILRRGGNAVPVNRGSNTNAIRAMDPWNDFDYMDRVFDSFFRAPFSMLERSRTERTEGSLELYETADELIVVAFAPGIKKDSFNISATANSVAIQAERKPLWEKTEGMTVHSPWATAATAGTFSAEYALPVEIDPNKVQATYTDGVLEIHLPKAESVKPRQVKVEVRGN